MHFSQRLEEITRDTSGPNGIAALVVTALATEESYYIAWKTLGGEYKQDGRGLPPLLQEWLFPDGGTTRDLASLQVVIGRDGEFWASDVNGKIEGSAAPAAPAPQQRLARAMTFPNKRRSVLFNAGGLDDIPGSPGERKRSSSTASLRTAAPPAPGLKRAPTSGFMSSIFGRGAATKVEPVAVLKSEEEERPPSPEVKEATPRTSDTEPAAGVPASPPKRRRPVPLRMGSGTNLESMMKLSQAPDVNTARLLETNPPPPPPKEADIPTRHVSPREAHPARTQPQLDSRKTQTTQPARIPPFTHRRGTSSTSKASLSALLEDTTSTSTAKANAKVPRLPLALNPISRTNTTPATASPTPHARSRTIAGIHPLPVKAGFAELPPAKRRCTCGYVDSIRVSNTGIQASPPTPIPTAPKPRPSYVDSGTQTDPPPPPPAPGGRGMAIRESFASSMPPSVFDTMSNRMSAATADTEVYYDYVDDNGEVYVDEGCGGPLLANPFPMGRMIDYFRSGGYNLGDALG